MKKSLTIILWIWFVTVKSQNVKMTTVIDCLSKCVGQTGKVFCPSDDKNSGNCCSNVLNCPRASTFNYCSSDFKNSTTLQQYMCPYESTYCGPSSILTG